MRLSALRCVEELAYSDPQYSNLQAATDTIQGLKQLKASVWQFSVRLYTAYPLQLLGGLLLHPIPHSHIGELKSARKAASPALVHGKGVNSYIQKEA